MYGVLKAYGCQIDEMITDVYSSLEKQQMGEYDTSNLQITPGVDRIMKHAIAQLIFLGRNSLQPFDLFLSITTEKNSYASYFINKYGINDISALMMFIKANPALVMESQNQDQAIEVLNGHCTNLNELAKNGQIDVLIGREKELQEIINTLAKRNCSAAAISAQPYCVKKYTNVSGIGSGPTMNSGGAGLFLTIKVANY